MKIRELIGTARIPGGDDLRLYRRGDDFIIAIGGNDLMNSRLSGSEEALAMMSCERLRSPGQAHLLIGGYGMGFTLRAALAALGPGAKITVAELVPEIIDWARGPMSALAAGCLDDPRVELVIGDVAAAIADGRGRYDAILLDVDNGPDGLVREANDGIYSPAGLASAKAALLGMTRSAARELAGYNIVVNAVAPAAATPMTEGLRNNDKLNDNYLQRIPLKRWAEPEEIAGTYVFLASDEATYMTGQVLAIDGGLVMVR